MRQSFAKLLLAASAIICLSANAQTFWRCTAYNRHGTQHWSRTRPTRYDAILDARTACQHNIRRTSNCFVPKSSCLRLKRPARQRCIVTDRRGRTWSVARGARCRRALQQCHRWHRRRSTNPRQCHIQ